MSEIIAEYADDVFASDIYRYRTAHPGEAVNVKTADFLSAEWHGPPSDWIVTNPPFGLSQRFLDRAMGVALRGVASSKGCNGSRGKGDTGISMRCIGRP